MNDRPTPETDAASKKSVPWAELGLLCRKLERERDELRERADANVNALLSCFAVLMEHWPEKLSHGMLSQMDTAISMLNPPIKFEDWNNDYKHTI